jgi:hypothetical protein
MSNAKSFEEFNRNVLSSIAEDADKSLEEVADDVDEYALPDWVKPGVSFRVFYGEGNVNNKKLHIRAVVDDDYVVLRKWSKSKQRWFYLVEDCYYFYFNKDQFIEKGKSND